MAAEIPVLKASRDATTVRSSDSTVWCLTIVNSIMCYSNRRSLTCIRKFYGYTIRNDFSNS